MEHKEDYSDTESNSEDEQCLNGSENATDTSKRRRSSSVKGACGDTISPRVCRSTSLSDEETTGSQKPIHSSSAGDCNYSRPEQPKSGKYTSFLLIV